MSHQVRRKAWEAYSNSNLNPPSIRYLIQVPELGVFTQNLLYKVNDDDGSSSITKPIKYGIKFDL